MKKFLIVIISIVFTVSSAYTQEEEKKKDKPVRSPFGSGILIDNQTCEIPTTKTLEMLIQHRFGKMDNGIKDIWGIYSPGANIRIGFNYIILDNLMIGYGLTSRKMQSDFQVKWNILQQTRKNTIPVAVALYGNMAIDGRDRENEGIWGVNYKFSNRLSYFGQLIVGRKFTDWLSIQLTASYTHYNLVDSTSDHDKIGFGINGRAMLSPQSSLIFQYDVPLKIKKISEQHEFINPPKPNFAFGWEISTSTHAFQIYITTADGILPQEIYMFNQNDWTKGFSDLMFGFTITRLWSF